MFGMPREQLNELKKKYPVGTKIRLISMPQEPNPVPRGTIGTVTGIDDLGTIHMNWNTHSTLGLVVGIDKFEIVENE